jgi:transketolase
MIVELRVVSMPCSELFDAQSVDYQLQVSFLICECNMFMMLIVIKVFPASVPVLSIEAASTTCWLKYAHATFGMTGFGTSAPGGQVA